MRLFCREESAMLQVLFLTKFLQKYTLMSAQPETDTAESSVNRRQKGIAEQKSEATFSLA